MIVMYEAYRKHLVALQNVLQHRSLPGIHQDRNKSYLDFTTNDYLCLSRNADILSAGIAAAREYGVGATGSRLLSGNNELFEIAESGIAKDKKTEAALLFSSGFQANLSVLSALLNQKILGQKPIVFFDRYNHASLYQAVFLSDSELVRYQHNNMIHLEELLLHYKSDARPKFIVTETVFGMDGDILAISEIAALAREYGTFLYLDEAHATGIFGTQGYGLSTLIDLTDIPHLIMGTFSKALGGSGGYVACSRILRDYLLNKAQGFIYSTAPSPFTVGAAFKAWKLLPDLSKKRSNLLALGDFLREKLLESGLNIGRSGTNIIPIILQEEDVVLHVKEELLRNQIAVSAIRPPTVPPHSSRLRVALTTAHQEKDVCKLIRVLKNTL